MGHRARFGFETGTRIRGEVMKEIDFLPSRLRRPSRHRRWSPGPLVAVAVLILILCGLHALRPARVSSAETAGTAPPSHGSQAESKPAPTARVHQTPDANRHVRSEAIDAVLAAIRAAESESISFETLELRSDSGAAQIQLHQDRREEPDAHVGFSKLLPQDKDRLLSGEVIGFASTDVDIGVLLARLSSCPSVGGARLAEACDAWFNDRPMRHFRIVFELRMAPGRR